VFVAAVFFWRAIRGWPLRSFSGTRTDSARVSGLSLLVLKKRLEARTMFKVNLRFWRWGLLAIWLASVGVIPWHGAASPVDSQAASEPESSLNWQSPARLRQGLRKVRGTLSFNAGGVEFKSEKNFTHRWPFVEIQTFDLTPHRFVLTSYENRDHRLPGDRRFQFDFTSDVSPAVAAELARRVGKPVKNGEPNPIVGDEVTLPARHVTRSGSSNGVLHFREDGIDYLTAAKRDARSWRWSDIQTLANPDAYHLRVGAFREIYNFELKQPMSPQTFDRLWDHVYAHDLEGLSTKQKEAECRNQRAGDRGYNSSGL
jgi:hypothetical protein